MPLIKVDPASRRNGPRLSIGEVLLAEVDRLRGDLTRPEFLCRAGYYLISRLDIVEDPDTGWTDEQRGQVRTGYRFAIDPELTDRLDEVRGGKSRNYMINKAGWVYSAHIRSLRI